MISLMVVLVLTAAVLVASQVAQPAQQDGVEVSGSLSTYNRKPLRSATVIMSPQDGDTGSSRVVGTARILPDGRFRFSNVPPGRYMIRARGEEDRNGTALFATYSIAVHGRDVDSVELTLMPGGTIVGHVEVRSRRGTPAPPLSALRVRAPLASGAAFGDTLSGSVSSGGAFRMAGLMPGTHVLVVEGLPFPWRISEARIQGRDAVEHAFELERDGQIREVRVVVTDTAAGVSGVVTLPPGLAPSDVLIVAFPADALKRRLPLRFVRIGRPDPAGGFQIVDLVPGECLVAAAHGLAEREALRPDMLDRLAASATPVRLVEGRITRVSLTVPDVHSGTSR